MLEMLAGNAVGLLLCGLGFVVFAISPNTAALAGLPSLLFVPFCMGLLRLGFGGR